MGLASAVTVRKDGTGSSGPIFGGPVGPDFFFLPAGSDSDFINVLACRG
jgi:hypothetical protein